MGRRVTPIWSHGRGFCPGCLNELDQEDLDFEDCSHCGGEDDDAAWDPSLAED